MATKQKQTVQPLASAASGKLYAGDFVKILPAFGKDGEFPDTLQIGKTAIIKKIHKNKLSCDIEVDGGTYLAFFDEIQKISWEYEHIDCTPAMSFYSIFPDDADGEITPENEIAQVHNETYAKLIAAIPVRYQTLMRIAKVDISDFAESDFSQAFTAFQKWAKDAIEHTGV